ncbi:spermidine/putrescine ABC transporter, periplasmic spermidine/putrescine-binding domain protein, partial [Vibrio parahaemolyticus V-223/04]|jgi:hypothetical protein
MPI